MKVKELLSSAEKWTKGAYARVSRGGDDIGINSHLATCWCLSGAVEKCYGHSVVYQIKLEELASAIPQAGALIQDQTPLCKIINFNDNTTWEQVKELLDRVDI